MGRCRYGRKLTERELEDRDMDGEEAEALAGGWGGGGGWRGWGGGCVGGRGVGLLLGWLPMPFLNCSGNCCAGGGG